MDEPRNNEEEQWMETEKMLRKLIQDTLCDQEKRVSTYRWALYFVSGFLIFVLGVLYEGDRLSATVITTRTDVTNLQREQTEMKNFITWVKDNAVTKADIKMLLDEHRRE